MIETPLTSNERRFLSLILVMIVVFVGADLFNDSQEGVKWSHLVVELVIAIGAALGMYVLMKDSFRKSHQLSLSHEVIVAREREVERWKVESHNCETRQKKP